MNEKGEEVGFDEKPAVGSLDKDLAAHSPGFRGEPLLVGKTADVLDDAIGENDIEALVGKGEVTPVANQRGKAPTSSLHAGGIGDIEESDRRLNWDNLFPIVEMTAHIQNPCGRAGMAPVEQELNPALPDSWHHPLV